mmetsp:Transcript_3077/g.3247  ORF Transcript_3077/g.3247 Transcript_3077/m.3247 type:complete len:99 (-) Transcript_3077:144-440(-)
MGGRDSTAYKQFIQWSVQTYLACRSVLNTIIALITSQADSGMPCFTHSIKCFKSLQDRLAPSLTASEAALKMRHLIRKAENHWTTVAYDNIQRYQNDI